jgi:hypothetical protein
VVAALTLIVACAVVALMGLTGVGAVRRGSLLRSAVLAGLFFPVTWTVWYVRDERPFAASD